MRIQIAICSWNRARLLEKTLQRLRQIKIPSNTQLQILVVDNASEDLTSRVIDQLSGELPIVKLYEQQRGHAFARNRALSAADGDLIIWTDDDVLPDENWLVHYVDAFQRHPTDSFWGGPIIPKFEDPAPKWIRENWEICKGCFAAKDLGSKEIELAKDKLPYGANLAVRTRAQKEYHFDTSLGRIGDRVVGDDEIEMLCRMLDGGHRGRWVPRARLQHLISPERMTERYVAAYFAGQGERVAAREPHAARSSTALLCESLYQQLLYGIKRPIAPSRVWISHLIRSALAKGKRNWQRRRSAA